MGKRDIDVAKDLIYLYTLHFINEDIRDDELETSIVLAVDHVLNPENYTATENRND